MRVGAPGRIVIAGTVTIRTAWDVPANAADLARSVVEHPPVERDGRTVLSDGVRVRTTTGSVDATLIGTGEADVETGSSVIRLRGITGTLKAVTRSGRVSIQGRPGSEWNVSTGCGGVDIAVDPATPFSVHAASGSGSTTLVGAEVQGPTAKRGVAGTVSGGGPLVHVNSRSGAVRITVAPI